MFKIAYCAGHYRQTPGKRMPAALDPKETREWVLNDRIADHFATAAAQYEGVELLRTDDPTGNTFIDIPERCAKANEWGADLYIDMHHNAGIRLGSGGGVEAYSYPGSIKGAEYRDAVYNAIITAGGIKGNRSRPTQAKAFDSLRLSNMAAILIEYGYMDSKTDAPIILTDTHAKLSAYATMEGVAKAAGLKKKTVVKPTVKPVTDNKYDFKTFVCDVQKAIGAGVDGIPGPETLSKTPTVSARKNNKHAVVKPIQKRLLALGYAEIGVADGIAGPKFTSAVAHFQQDNNDYVDGVITARNKTWKKLLNLK
jgi:N-acetylmuramoyl-L-alanine amidase